MNHRAQLVSICSLVAAMGLAVGCHQPERWSYTGPRVYLIEGAADEQSDGLAVVRDELAKQEVNAKIYYPDDWLKIVIDIDAKPDEEAIIVGHGHGAFLATQVVRHYAQEHKTKFIESVITIDAFNKDWPHNGKEAGCCDPHCQPMNTPIGHNALEVHNFVQQNPDSKRWGSNLVSTRASNVALNHPYYWYDDYWDRRPVNGQIIAEKISGVTHENIDNQQELVQRIVKMCRKAALSPYHYTPPEHHPDVKPKAPTPGRSKAKAA